MVTTKRSVSLRLDPVVARRLKDAARLTNQSLATFLERAGQEAAHRILLEEAVSRYRNDTASLSELSAETGVEVEAIFDEVAERNREGAEQRFLAVCKAFAEEHDDPDFYRFIVEQMEAIRAEASASHSEPHAERAS